jgi:hypothetical protein
MRSNVILPRVVIVTCLLAAAFVVLAVAAPPDAISTSKAAQYDYSGLSLPVPSHEPADVLDYHEADADPEWLTAGAEQEHKPYALFQPSEPEPLRFEELLQSASIARKNVQPKSNVKTTPQIRRSTIKSSRPSKKSTSPWGAFNKSKVRPGIFSQNKTKMHQPFGGKQAGRNTLPPRGPQRIKATIPRYHRKWWE